MSDLRKRLSDALTEERWDDYDETWLDYIEQEKATLPEMLDSARDAIKAKQGHRANLPLSLVVHP